MSTEIDIPKPNEKSTSPKSNREYITSFTTTTTTTQKPHIEKGVKIIRNLVERARNNEDANAEKPIQSLTTIKPMTTSRGKSTTTLRSTTFMTETQTLPMNHKHDSDETIKKSIRPQQKQNEKSIENDGLDFSEEDSTEDVKQKTTVRATATTTASKKMNSVTSSRTSSTTPVTKSSTYKEIANITPTETAITINDVEDLINKVQTTTRNGKASTTRAKSTTQIPSNNEDTNFLEQVVNSI